MPALLNFILFIDQFVYRQFGFFGCVHVYNQALPVSINAFTSNHWMWGAQICRIYACVGAIFGKLNISNVNFIELLTLTIFFSGTESLLTLVVLLLIILCSLLDNAHDRKTSQKRTTPMHSAINFSNYVPYFENGKIWLVEIANFVCSRVISYWVGTS